MIRSFFSNFEEIVVGTILGAMFLLVIANVVARYVFGSPFFFVDELSCFLLIWLAFIGAAAVQKKSQHINMTFVIDMLSLPVRRKLAWLVSGIVITTTLLIFFYGSILVKNSSIMRMPAMEFSVGYLYVPLPISGLLIIIHLRKWLFRGPSESLERDRGGE